MGERISWESPLDYWIGRFSKKSILKSLKVCKEFFSSYITQFTTGRTKTPSKVKKCKYFMATKKSHGIVSLRSDKKELELRTKIQVTTYRKQSWQAPKPRTTDAWWLDLKLSTAQSQIENPVKCKKILAFFLQKSG